MSEQQQEIIPPGAIQPSGVGYASGRHPNSLANLSSKGMTNNPGGRRKKLPITGRIEAELEKPLPLDTAEGQLIRAKLDLGDDPGVTWGDAIAAAAVRRAVTQQATVDSITASIEGRAMQRVEISGPDKKEIRLRVVYEKGDDQKA